MAVTDDEQALLEAETCEYMHEEEPIKNISKCFPCLIPQGLWQEFKQLFKLAIPIVLTSMITFLFGPITLIFCGHLGSNELAAAGLAISVFNVTGVAIIFGLLCACDTLFSQTFGGEDKYRMGIQLQRGCLLITLLCLPCWSLHLLIEPILLGLNQDPWVAKNVSIYLLYMFPSLWFVAIHLTFSKYIQCQNKVMPPLIIGLIGNFSNAILQYLLVIKADYQLPGSAAAQSLAYGIQCLFIVLYWIGSGLYKQTWNGVTKDMWYDWGIWFKLAIPGLLMVSMEWWIFEFGTFAAGTLGEIQLASQSILLNIQSFTYTILPLGFGTAASIRIGQGLGAKSEHAAVVTMTATLVILGFTSVISAMTWYLLRNIVPVLFTDDPNVIAKTASAMQVIAGIQLFDGTLGACTGIVRGAGMQKIGALIGFVCLYLIALPMGMCLLFFTTLELNGLWIGIFVGIVFQSSVYLFICFRIDWKKQIKLATERTFIRSVNACRSYSAIVEEIEALSGNDATTSRQHIICEIDEFIRPRETEQAVGSNRRNTICVINRFILIAVIMSVFLACLALHFKINWMKYIGTCCFSPSETFVRIKSTHSKFLKNVFFLVNNLNIY